MPVVNFGTKNGIEVNFREAMKLSAQLEGLAEAMKILGEDTLMQNICAIKTVWNSESADLFLGKEVKLVSQLQEEAIQIKELAGDLAKCAQIMYQIEMGNQILAVTRLY